MTNVLDPEFAQKVREQQLAKAIEWAADYRVFKDDARAARLLAHWTKAIGRVPIAPNETLGEVMRHIGKRDFINGIVEQLELSGAVAPVPAKADPFA